MIGTRFRMEKEKIEQMLEVLPDKILIKEQDILEKSREADKTEAEVKSTEVSYEFQITGELEKIEKDGELVKKKKFKNDLERTRELESRLINNSTYNTHKQNMLNLRKEIKDEEIKLNYQKKKENMI